MKIDDLLTMAGKEPLQSFTWGLGIIEIINGELLSENKIGPETSGLKARSVVRTLLPSAALIRLLSIDFDEEGIVIVEETECRVPARTTVKKAAKQKKKTMHVPRIHGRQPKPSVVPMVIGVVITLCSLLLTATLSFTTTKPGQKPEDASVSSLFKLMGETFKAYLSVGEKASATSPPATPKPQPVPEKPVTPAHAILRPPAPVEDSEQTETLLPTTEGK